jgi:hypothetical protein
VVDTVTEAVSSVLHLGQQHAHRGPSSLKQPEHLEGGLPLKQTMAPAGAASGRVQGGGSRVDVPPRAGQDMPAMAAAFSGQAAGPRQQGGQEPGGAARGQEGVEVEGAEPLLVREGAGGPEYSGAQQGAAAEERADTAAGGKSGERALQREGEGPGGTVIKQRAGRVDAPAGVDAEPAA